MTLRVKILSLVVATFFLLVAVMFFVVREVTLNRYTEMEESFLHQDLYRGISITENRLQDLMGLAQDWATWDTLQACLSPGDHHRIGDHFSPELLESLKVDYVLLLDEEHTLSCLRDPHAETYRDAVLSAEQLKQMIGNSEGGFPAISEPFAAIKHTSSNIMLVAGAPVEDISDNGEVIGQLILFQELRGSFQHMLKYLTGLSYELMPLEQFDHEAVKEQLLSGETFEFDTFHEQTDWEDHDHVFYVEPLSKDLIRGFSLIRHFRGADDLVISVVSDRNIMQQGMQTMRYFIYAVMIVGLIFAVIIVLLLDELIASRVVRLTERVREIRRSGDQDASFLLEDGGDELSQLSVDIARTFDAERLSLAQAVDARDRMQQYLDIVQVIVVALDRNGCVELINQRGCAVLEREEQELLGADWFESCIPPEAREGMRNTFERIIAGEQEPVEHYENEILTAGGERRLIAWHNTFLRNEQGEIVSSLSSGEDVSARITTEKALQFTQFAVDQASDAFYCIDHSGHLVYVNEAACDILGYPQGELLDLKIYDIDKNLTVAEWQQEWDRLFARQYVQVESIHLRRDGSEVPVDIVLNALMYADRQLVFAYARDISERKKAEADIEQRDAILEAVGYAAQRFLSSSAWQDELADVLSGFGKATRTCHTYLYENRIDEQGHVWAEMRGEWINPLVPEGHFDSCERVFSYQERGFSRWQDVLSRQHILNTPVEDLPPEEAAIFEVMGVKSTIAVPIFVGEQWWGFMGLDDCNSPRAWSEVEMDALQLAAQTLSAAISRLRSEERIRLQSAALNSADNAIMISDKEGAILWVNPAFTHLTGYTMEEVVGRSPSILKSGQHDAAFYKRMWTKVLNGGTWKGKVINRRKDGTEYNEQMTITAIRGREGGVEYFVAIKEDISDRLVAEQERKALQKQLLQSQKMEAIGKLAGGIAHDFNNILSVINGFSQLILDNAESDPVREDVEEIYKAGQRAAELTSQLLAFSRKQLVQAEVVNLNQVIQDTENMLRRTIPENISLEIALHEGLWSIKADRSMMDQVILNLIVNARDALEEGGGGNVSLETENISTEEYHRRKLYDLPPGQYVMLAVTDDGCGMDDQTKLQLFEPFFTTKDKGKGTGLGLSVTYGIVRQSEGIIRVHSSPGKGARFELIFPAVEDEEPGPAAQEQKEVTGGTETILLVEDEDKVRYLAKKILTRWGYGVIEAGNGPEALDYCSGYSGQIDLLLTDVVMPGMSGRELRDEVIKIYPDLKVLYMTGYTDDALIRHGISTGPMTVLQKPFTAEKMIEMVRRMLDA